MTFSVEKKINSKINFSTLSHRYNHYVAYFSPPFFCARNLQNCGNQEKLSEVSTISVFGPVFQGFRENGMIENSENEQKLISNGKTCGQKIPAQNTANFVQTNSDKTIKLAMPTRNSTKKFEKYINICTQVLGHNSVQLEFQRSHVSIVCVFYYCRTYYKAVRVGGGGEWRTCAMRDDEPRPVWMSLPITH